MNAREELAKQIGFLILANIEQAAQLAALQKKLDEANQRLHEIKADNQPPHGAPVNQ